MKQRARWIVLSAFACLFLVFIMVLGSKVLYLGPPLPSERVNIAEWRALGAEAWGAEKPGEWWPVQRVVDSVRDIEQAVDAASPQVDVLQNTAYRFGEHRWTTLGSASGSPQASVAESLDGIEPLEQAIADLEAAGIFEQVKAWPSTAPVQEDAIGGLPTDQFSTIALLQKFRLLRSVDAGDTAGVVDASLVLLSIARVTHAQPLVTTWYGGNAYESMLLWTVAKEAVCGRLSPEMAEALVGLTEEVPEADMARAFAGTLISARDGWRWNQDHDGWDGVFVWNSAAAQFAPIEATYSHAIDAWQTLPPDQAIAEMERRFSALDKWGFLYYSIREGEISSPALHFSLSRWSRVVHEGLQIVLAIEAYRLAEGRVPASLDMLVGRYLDAAPPGQDARFGFGYAPGDDPTLPGAAGGFSLYNIGYDGIDNGGFHRPGEPPQQALRQGFDGTDFTLVGVDGVILNQN